MGTTFIAERGNRIFEGATTELNPTHRHEAELLRQIVTSKEIQTTDTNPSHASICMEMTLHDYKAPNTSMDNVINIILMPSSKKKESVLI